MELPAHAVIHYLLIFIRISSFIMVAPFWSNTSISTKVKIGLCGLISFIAGHVVEPVGIFPESFLEILFLIFNQIFLGVLLGFVSHLFLHAIRTAASILDIAIGFGFGKILDPSLGAQSSVLELFYGITCLLILVITNGHLLILKAVISSFKLVPLDGKLQISNSLVNFIISMTGEIFMIVLQIAGPIIAIIFLIDISLGIVAKTMPQMNVFIFGLPLKLGLGIIGVIVCMPGLPDIISIMVNDMLEKFIFVSKLLIQQ